jgi:hypothetical protein
MSAKPASLWLRAANSLERIRERPDAVEAQVTLPERPRREVDVRVREPGNDAAPAEVDDLRRRQRRLVRPDPARDAVACDRESARQRQSRVQRADRPVFQDHARRL